MTPKKRCKICGKLIGKTHNCIGYKEMVSCPECSMRILKTSLAKHLIRKCPQKVEKYIHCACGDTVIKGHGHEARHIETGKHKQWEIKDRKIRKLGIVKDSTGRYSEADPDSEDIKNPNYYRSVPYGSHIKECHLLDKQNKIFSEGKIIYCYCGINSSETEYGKHCNSKFHKNWVNKAIEFYKCYKEEHLKHANKMKEYRKRRKARTEFYKKVAEKCSGEGINLGKPKKSINDPDIEFEYVNQENTENVDDSREYRKKALEILKSLKCTGNCVFFRGKEIEEILEKIEKTKYFLLNQN